MSEFKESLEKESLYWRSEYRKMRDGADNESHIKWSKISFREGANWAHDWCQKEQYQPCLIECELLESDIKDLKAKLAVAESKLEKIVEVSGTSTEHWLLAAQALTQIRGGSDE